MSTYDIVLSTDESTVVTEYKRETTRPETYQSEAELEKNFINLLVEQGYEYREIHNENELILNLRRNLEELNDYQFTDNEWDRFYTSNISNRNEGIAEKTRKIQEDHVQVLRKDDGSFKNIYLIDKRNVHNNRLQVINQYEEEGGRYSSRYDVTILVNGIPMVHTELKRRGVAIREAFNQISRYQRESFWASGGLFEYIHIFIISNGTNTKYYSNTTREGKVKERVDGSSRKRGSGNSFEFTSFWADAKNNTIPDLVDFTRTFLAKHTILNVLARYCVFTSEDKLLVMRPYQIAATERILSKIEISNNYNLTGTVDAGGYIWHATGSGKTLTSFKAARLASGLPYIDKVLFVVDRKDLDYQTMKEYDRFEKGAASGNTSTRILQKQLEDSSSKIIITTIQKLSIFVKRNKDHPVYKKHIIMIFDECHRSQFGEMHLLITKAFKKYHLFGFTGTPIFPVNAPSGGNPALRTTEQAFGKKLHTYTVVDAIRDGNVLPFRLDYINTVSKKEGLEDSEVSSIDTDRILMAPERIHNIVEYTLDRFDQKTKRGSTYTLKDKRVSGFNSIFAVGSIPMAIEYYKEFKKQLAERNENLKIAMIYSFAPNEEEVAGLLSDETFDTSELDRTSRDFLESAIRDYNETFKVNFDTSSEKFESYYKDVSSRVKNKEVDMLIVVNMFLTGFDATTLNTLWVDKNLRQHGLIQAFSRTNRIFNSVKTFGNIICFRNLQKETDEAISLFGDKDAGGTILLKSYDYYYDQYKGYIKHLLEEFSLNERISGEEDEKEFIKLFSGILRLRNILLAFDDFEDDEILNDREFQDYQSRYLDIYQKYKEKDKSEKTDVTQDVKFEIELVRQVEINIDYILRLIESYCKSNRKDKEVMVQLRSAIGSSIQLRSKRELIEKFIEKVGINTNIDDEWGTFVTEQWRIDLDTIIEEEELKPEETEVFVRKSFKDDEVSTIGTGLDDLLPPMSLFDDSRADKKQRIIDRLQSFFEKYQGLA